MTATIEIPDNEIERILKSKSDQIKELKLALKEQTILLTASTKREREGRELMGYIKDVLGAACMWGPYEKACKFLGVEK
jgi:hypothetical protein